MKQIIRTEHAPKPVGPYSQAIQSGNLVFVAGQGALDPQTGEVQRQSVAALGIVKQREHRQGTRGHEVAAGALAQRRAGTHAFATRTGERAVQPRFSRPCRHGATQPRFLANGARLLGSAGVWRRENRASEAPAPETRQGREAPRMPGNSRPDARQPRPHPWKGVLAGSNAEIRGMSRRIAVVSRCVAARRAPVASLLAHAIRIQASQVRPDLFWR